MRTQPTKPQPNKGALLKSSFKQHAPTKQVKKKQTATTKNIKTTIKKAVTKPAKKNKVTNPEIINEESAEGDAGKARAEGKAETSKSPLSTRANSPAKKNKNEKEKKIATKKTASLLTKKKPSKQKLKVIKSNPTTEDNVSDSADEIKYKINSEHVKHKKTKPTKPKVISKTSAPMSSKKHTTSSKIENLEVKPRNKETDKIGQNSVPVLEKPAKSESNSVSDNNDGSEVKGSAETKTVEGLKTPSSSSLSSNVASNDQSPSTLQKPKTENERPPKFFTSTRSPRVVDIDLKSCKTTKTNLSVTDKFLCMKSPVSKITTADKIQEEESSCSISKEPEIDVYTFTDYKVDSPKSILPDFRSPIGKNIGRVRPIARVKGTVVDKSKGEVEKKKYSPHRPIEEVVKQLKAGKRAEEARLLLGLSDNTLENKKPYTTPDSIVGETSGTREVSDASVETKPKSMVSKSYKMVARKSNIPGTAASSVISESDGPSKDNDTINKGVVHRSKLKKTTNIKKKVKNKRSNRISDEEIDHSTFSLNTSSTSHAYSSSDESESNYDTKESSDSEASVHKKFESNRKKGRNICDSERKSTSKDLEALSPDSLVDLKESSSLIGDEKPSKRRLKLLSMWTGPKKHRMASLNALAKVHCLYENESRSHSELGLMKTIERTIPLTTKSPVTKKKKAPKQDKNDSTSDSDYEKKEKMVLESSEEDSPTPGSTRTLRVVPGARGSGKYWDHKSSTSSSEESEADFRQQAQFIEKKKTPAKTTTPTKFDIDKSPEKMKKTVGVQVKKKRNRNEVVMDLKDMVVQKRMASLNATAILAASYEKRSPKSNRDETTTSDSCSDKDETYAKKSKNGVATGVKSEAGIKIDECKKETECSPPKQKVEVIVNQDTDVTITGVYSTHHEGFCTVSGLKYRISSTSHTQTTATASSEKEGCSHDDGSRYTPLSALSSMQPPPTDPAAAPPHHPHQHPGHEHRGLGLGRRPGCSSAFSAPPPTHTHHEPGYYQPAGPLIKEAGGEAEGRALTRYHPSAHYHPHPHPPHPHPHPQMLQHYGPPYYLDQCYGRYYPPRPSGYLPPPQPQPDAQMVGVTGEPYPPPPQYYTGGPCYHNSHQRVPYLEYRGCPCPMNSCPKNVLIGPATGKPPTGGGPADTPTVAVAPPGGAFTAKARAARGSEPETNITNGKDPPEEPPAAADAPHARYHPPHPPPTFSGVSPKREMCDDFRVTTDGLAAEALGPPSPARGSAGACVPQPPPAPAPMIQPLRRARLGKAMVRKTLVGEETAALMMCPQPATQPFRTLPPAPAPPVTISQEDDDVLVLSPPDVECTPIDLSSDETEKRDNEPRERLLADVKKENEGPDGGQTPAVRKPALAAEAQALREHNSPCVPASEPIKPDPPKPQPAKRRYSRPKLEVEPILELVDGRPTNGIGEHVKLQKRRKLVPEPDAAMTERNSEIENKKKSPTKKRGPKLEPEAKRCNKRKSSSGTDAPPMKRIISEPPKALEIVDARHQNPAAVCEKPKIRSALLLDKLIRKNSVDRDIGDYEPDPAELFLPPSPNVLSHNGVKKIFNINNNVVGEKVSINDTRPTEPVPRLIADRILAKIALGKQTQKKLSSKANAKATATKLLSEPLSDKNSVKNQFIEKTKPKKSILERKIKLSNSKPLSVEALSSKISQKESSSELLAEKSEVVLPEVATPTIEASITTVPCPKTDPLKSDKSKLPPPKSDVVKPAEKCLKLLSSKTDVIESSEKSKVSSKTDILKPKEKVSKLLCSKVEGKPVIEPSVEAMEEICTVGATAAARRAGRRKSVGGRRRLRLATGSACGANVDDLPVPRAQPRWSNGWIWEGQPFVAKVYLNNDMRQDGVRRCYSGMVHSGGDRVRRGDCVLLRAAARRGPEQPYVARVGHLWENPDDGEMMVSLVWYYRPEHTELARQPDDAPDEVFASRHRDANSVACIEDKCYVLTFNEYCRYRKRLKATEEGMRLGPSIVPPMPASDITPGIAPADSRLPPSVSPELVLFCRKIYDFRSKKIHVPNK